jgi:hypothetical protein
MRKLKTRDSEGFRLAPSPWRMLPRQISVR